MLGGDAKTGKHQIFFAQGSTFPLMPEDYRGLGLEYFGSAHLTSSLERFKPMVRTLIGNHEVAKWTLWIIEREIPEAEKQAHQIATKLNTALRQYQHKLELLMELRKLAYKLRAAGLSRAEIRINLLGEKYRPNTLTISLDHLRKGQKTVILSQDPQIASKLKQKIERKYQEDLGVLLVKTKQMIN
mgnify:CR=1 FL=1